MARYSLSISMVSLSWRASSCVRAVRRSGEAHRQGSGDCSGSWRGRHGRGHCAGKLIASLLSKGGFEKGGSDGYLIGRSDRIHCDGRRYRFAFSIPTYGCGDLADTPNQYGAALHYNALLSRGVGSANLAVARDHAGAVVELAFPLTSRSASYRAAPSPHMAAIRRTAMPTQNQWSKRGSHGSGKPPMASFSVTNRSTKLSSSALRMRTLLCRANGRKEPSLSNKKEQTCESPWPRLMEQRLGSLTFKPAI
jgi:hypothetical protein